MGNSRWIRVVAAALGVAVSLPVGAAAQGEAEIESTLSVDIPEDSWSPGMARAHRWYIDAGASGVLFEEPDPVPDSVLGLEIGVGPAISAGYWFHPYVAADLLLTGRFQHSTEFLNFGPGPADRADQRVVTVAAGLRFAAPTYLSPVIAVHLGYGYEGYRWMHYGSQITSAASVQDHAHSLIADAEFGLQGNFDHFTATLSYRIAGRLAGTVDRSILSGAYEAAGSISPKLSAQGFQIRIGARF